MEELEDPGKHISETKNSKQVKRLLEEVEEDYKVQDEIEESAVKTYEEDEKVVVSSISYGLDQGSSGIFLDLNSFLLENGERGTVGYILDGDTIVKEYRTDDEIMPDCKSAEFNGDTKIMMDSKKHY